MTDIDAERMVAALIEGDHDRARQELARMLGEKPDSEWAEAQVESGERS